VSPVETEAEAEAEAAAVGGFGSWRRRDLLLAGDPLVLPLVLLFSPSSSVLGSCR